MHLTEAQRFAQAIRASFKTPLSDLNPISNSSKKPSTLSRGITRKIIKEQNVKDSSESPQGGVNSNPDLTRTKKNASNEMMPPMLPPMPSLSKLTMSDVDSDTSSNPSTSSSKTAHTSRATSNSSFTVDSHATRLVDASRDVVERGRRVERCRGGDEDEGMDMDMEESVVVQLNHAPRRVKFEAGVKARVLEAHQGSITREGKKIYVGRDVATEGVGCVEGIRSDTKDAVKDAKDLVGDTKKMREDVKVGGGANLNEGVGIKRSRKLSTKLRTVRQWVHELT